MLKKIPVGDGYEIVFLHRERGEESPCWRGQVLKDGNIVGSFRNDGRGGATNIQPTVIVAAFEKLVDEAAPEVSPAKLPERDALVVTYAEAKGYDESRAGVTLADVVREFVNALLGFAADVRKPS